MGSKDVARPRMLKAGSRIAHVSLVAVDETKGIVQQDLPRSVSSGAVVSPEIGPDTPALQLVAGELFPFQCDAW